MRADEISKLRTGGRPAKVGRPLLDVHGSRLDCNGDGCVDGGDVDVVSNYLGGNPPIPPFPSGHQDTCPPDP